MFFKELLWGLWPGLSRAQASRMEPQKQCLLRWEVVWRKLVPLFELTLVRSGGWFCLFVLFWLELLQEPFFPLFLAVLPSNWALCVLFRVQVVLRLLQVPGLLSGRGKLYSLEEGRWVWAWESSSTCREEASTCKARMGNVLCRVLVWCYPLLTSIEG